MFEYLVGLQVSDEAMYRQYREAMLPILGEHGGSFGYDFRVSEVLINVSRNPINRVFTIRFPNEATSNAFFNNEQYLKAKEHFFNNAVECTTILAQFENPS